MEAAAAALRCLGRALGQSVAPLLPPATQEAAWGASPGSPQLLEQLQAFAADVAAAVRPDQPEVTRAAAVEALASSQLLLLAPWPEKEEEEDTGEGTAQLLLEGEPVPTPTPALAPGDSAGQGEDRAAMLCVLRRLSLRGWLSALTLLQDEDLDVRLHTAAVAQACLARLRGPAHLQQRHAQPFPATTSTSTASDALSSQGQGQGQGQGRGSEAWGGSHQGVFVGVVVRQLLQLLGASCGVELEAQAALQRLVLDPEQPLPDLLQGQVRVGEGGKGNQAGFGNWGGR